MGRWKDEYWAILPVVAALVLIVWQMPVMFSTHFSSGGDSIWHYANAKALLTRMNLGETIVWFPDDGLGWPMTRVYPSLLYYLAISLTGITGSLVLSLNALAGIFIALTPISIYYFAQQLRLSRLEAGITSFLSLFLIGGWAYSIEAFYELGTLTFALLTFLTPLLLGLLAKFIHEGSIRIGILALTIELLFLLSHKMAFAYAAFFILPFILVLALSEKQGIRCFLIGFGFIMILLIMTIPHALIYPEFSSNILYETFGGAPTQSFSSGQFVKLLITGQILDRTHNFGLSYESLFRWADNAHIWRLPVLTIALLVGLLYLIWNFRTHLALILLWALTIILVLGPDDMILLRLLPFASSVQFLRFAFLFQLLSIIIAAVGITSALTFLWSTHSRVVRYGGVLLIIALAVSPLHERNVSATGYIEVKQPHVELGYALLLNQTTIRTEGRVVPTSDFPFYLSGIVKYYGYESLLDLSTHNTIYGPMISTLSFAEPDYRMYELFNIHYILTTRAWYEKHRPNASIIGETPERVMLRLHVPYGYYHATTDYASTTNMSALPWQLGDWIRSYQSSNATFQVYGNVPVSNGSCRIIWESRTPLKYTAEVDTDAPCLVILKMAYSKAWTAYIDGHEARHYLVTPGYNGVIVDQPCLVDFSI